MSSYGDFVTENEQLEKDIKADIENSDNLYSKIKLKTVIKYADYKLDIGSNINDSREKLWDYFSKRYKQQIELESKYKKMHIKLKNKNELLNKMKAESEKQYENQSVAISNIKATKHELDNYQSNNAILYYIMIVLLAINIILIIWIRINGYSAGHGSAGVTGNANHKYENNEK